ncbi:hypothetical protein M9Y10_040265 [Tritrichomonas musculus]|uniref:Uncharacterized protein n=1 Tax=Tritrichomonas musculus TaxID=1915356 RepID=A0ABR2GQN0_9EUKA
MTRLPPSPSGNAGAFAALRSGLHPGAPVILPARRGAGHLRCGTRGKAAHRGQPRSTPTCWGQAQRYAGPDGGPPSNGSREGDEQAMSRFQKIAGKLEGHWTQ